MPSLEGKVAVVTGAAGGMGRVICDRLAGLGASVAAVDMNEEGITDLVGQLSKKHAAKCISVSCDVSSSKSVKQMTGKVESELGHTNILINGAGYLQLVSFLDLTEEDWDKMLDVNLKSVFLVTQALLPGMMETDYGRVITISSLAGKVGGIIAGIHYATTKGAHLAFTKSLARLIGPLGFTANCVCPYMTDTDMADVYTSEQIEAFEKQNPMGRLGKAEDMAAAVAFLASPEASFVNAEMMDVDGGYTAD